MAGQWKDPPIVGDEPVLPDPVTSRKRVQWADDDDARPVPRRANDIEASASYHARRPEPNYSQFQAEYVDHHGREYALARTGDLLEAQTDVQNEIYDTPPLTGAVSVKRLLLWLRMPINQRHTVSLPEPDGEKLVLYYVAAQVLCTAKTDGVFVDGPRARTGHVFVRNFETHGQASDPGAFEPWLRISEEPGNHHF